MSKTVMKQVHSRLALRLAGMVLGSLIGSAALLNSALASTAPAPLTSLVGQQASLLGEGKLRFLGLTVYEARLWSAAKPEMGKLFDRPLALELTYRTGLQGGTITSTSRDEIERLGLATKPGQIESWESQMRTIFPNVVSGDRILGVHLPNRGALFFLNDQPIGQVNDAQFSEAFFNIWLHPETRVASLRKKLLSGLNP
jgi:hypothetical protein